MGKYQWGAERKHRMAISIPAAHLTADHIQVVILDEVDVFWDGTQSDGYDVLFVNASGSTLTHERTVWTDGTQATFEVLYSTVVGAVTKTELVWLYFGAETAVVVDPSAAVANTLENPHILSFTDPRSSPYLVTATVPTPGATTPLTRLAKTSYEEIVVWFDITVILGEATGTYFGRPSAARNLSRSVGPIDWDATAGTGAYLAGTRQAAMTTQTETQIVEVEDHLYVGILVDSGTDAVDYTLILRGETNNIGTPADAAAMFEVRALLQVRDPAE